MASSSFWFHLLVQSILFLSKSCVLIAAVDTCGEEDNGYSMYVWTQGFNATAPVCNGIYPESKTGEFASCWYHNWESPTSRQHLWATTKIPGRKVTRIFLSDVKRRIEHDGYASTSNVCDADLVSFLTEAHRRGIKVYALFAVSDEAFSETYMARYPHQFNTVCGRGMAYFDGVSVNNEYFSSVRDCTVENEAAQLQFLTNLNTTVTNSFPLPLHFSVSWNWDCCDCSSSSYVPRNLIWNGENKSALAHMIDIADSVDVQVAYNVPEVMRKRAVPPYNYWTNKLNKSSTSALYVLAYTNPTSLCQLSFAPHQAGSTTVTDTCAQGNRTEAGMFSAFDYVEAALPGAIGGIHYMSGVFSTGITEGWPKHDLLENTCALNYEFDYEKNQCIKKCLGTGMIWNWKRCDCKCPNKCKRIRKSGKCKPRCKDVRYKWKWNDVGGTCILRESEEKGWIWDRSRKKCTQI